MTFSGKGVGVYGVGYQWKTNGVNLAGATNTTLTVTNVQPAQDGATFLPAPIGSRTRPSGGLSAEPNHSSLVPPPRKAGPFPFSALRWPIPRQVSLRRNRVRRPSLKRSAMRIPSTQKMLPSGVAATTSSRRRDFGIFRFVKRFCNLEELSIPMG